MDLLWICSEFVVGLLLYKKFTINWTSGVFLCLVRIPVVMLQYITASGKPCLASPKLRRNDATQYVKFQSIFKVTFSVHCVCCIVHFGMRMPSNSITELPCSGPELRFFSERVINVWNQLPESTDFSSLSSVHAKCSLHWSVSSLAFLIVVCFYFLC